MILILYFTKIMSVCIASVFCPVLVLILFFLFFKAIVFMVGGGNYIEYQNLMDYVKVLLFVCCRNSYGAMIITGTTRMLFFINSGREIKICCYCKSGGVWSPALPLPPPSPFPLPPFDRARALGLWGGWGMRSIQMGCGCSSDVFT